MPLVMMVRMTLPFPGSEGHWPPGWTEDTWSGIKMYRSERWPPWPFWDWLADDDGGDRREAHHKRPVIQMQDPVALGIDHNAYGGDHCGHDNGNGPVMVHMDAGELHKPLILRDGREDHSRPGPGKQPQKSSDAEKEQQEAQGDHQLADPDLPQPVQDLAEIIFQVHLGPQSLAADGLEQLAVGHRHEGIKTGS